MRTLKRKIHFWANFRLALFSVSSRSAAESAAITSATRLMSYVRVRFANVNAGITLSVSADQTRLIQHSVAASTLQIITRIVSRRCLSSQGFHIDPRTCVICFVNRSRNHGTRA